ncbi:MAG: MarR family transcriptional regulator [Salegentibacter sp.]
MNIEELIKTTNQLPESRRLILNLTVTANHTNEKLAEALKPFDVSLPQFNVLRILRGQKGNPANLCTIQERMVAKMSNTTRLVDKLISKGLAKRTVCAKNRRKIEIFITDEGLEILKKIDPVIDSTEKDLTANLDEDELKIANKLMNKLRG